MHAASGARIELLCRLELASQTSCRHASKFSRARSCADCISQLGWHRTINACYLRMHLVSQIQTGSLCVLDTIRPQLQKALLCSCAFSSTSSCARQCLMHCHHCKNAYLASRQYKRTKPPNCLALQYREAERATWTQLSCPRFGLQLNRVVWLWS